MNAKEIEALESYFKTENEHWNGYAFEMICEVLKHGNFENPEIALKLSDKAVNIFTQHHETPLKAVQEFATETDKQKLTPSQKLFVNEWIFRYLTISDFGLNGFSEIEKLLKCEIKRLKNTQFQIENSTPFTGHLRKTLKELMQKEIQSLSNTLNQLEPKQRLNIICKLIPYVLPKVESVLHSEGEIKEVDEQVHLFNSHHIY